MIRYAAMGHQGAVLAHNRVDRSGVYKRALSTSTRPSYLQDSSDGSHSGRGKPAEMARSSSSGGTEAAQHTETHPNMACKRTASRFYTRQVPNMACKRNASRLHGGDQHVHVHAHVHMHVHGLDGITASATQGRAAPVSGEQTPRVVTKDPPLAPPRWGGNDPSIVAAHGVVIHGRGVVKLVSDVTSCDPARRMRPRPATFHRPRRGAIDPGASDLLSAAESPSRVRRPPWSIAHRRRSRTQRGSGKRGAWGTRRGRGTGGAAGGAAGG
eukprot:CAMPEP_0181212246 /NCGR_PEP_ID=MMETSP1096-20121128/24244_1 /TAXON_ID=156174 ORGANISM="Chrysochromulina ericina, Strain CCMP281" /NCGR_SAMPLE_ID=MMETSP1096 /ASSEMBLY_ACC=CAM_ASM_000453 /LENGTH=268 /DNA_ID=CAMNT_0023303755 /DNA_START=192 /DNA_END=996 /DNA_ORIENTATION=+